MTAPPDYKALSAAVVLYTYRLRSLETGVEDLISAARQDEYTAAYNQLLRTHNTKDNGTFPDDPGAEANATHVSENHILALRSAIPVLTEALRAIERERKAQEENKGQIENLLEFVAFQELSSRALHQAMLRFVEYHDIVSRESMKATEQTNAFDYSSESHSLIRQSAILTRDRAICDENWWSDRIVSLANMIAVQVQNEEDERRMLQTQPRSAAGGNDDIGESPEDDDGFHEEDDEDNDEDNDYDTDEDTDESLPGEETEDTTNQSRPDADVNESLPHAEGDVYEQAASEERSDHEAECLNIGTMSLEDELTTRSTVDRRDGTASMQTVKEGEKGTECGCGGGERNEDPNDDGNSPEGAALDKGKGACI